MPNLNTLLDGRSLLKDAAPFYGEHASLLAVDPAVGVRGLPQSATGQAILVTGINILQNWVITTAPKPNPEVAAYLNDATLFSRFAKEGKKTALLNAYPPRYFEGIDSGKRLYSSIPLAVTNAGFCSSGKMLYLRDTPFQQILLAKAGETCWVSQTHL